MGVGLLRFILEARIGIPNGAALADAPLRLGVGDLERCTSLPTALEAAS